MRLALHFDFPGLKEIVLNLFPDLDIFVIPSGVDKPLPENLQADVLLTSSHLVNSNLSQVLEQCAGLQWVHVFGTGIDNFPLQLMGDKLLSCGRGSSAVPIAEWVMAMMLNVEKKLPQSLTTQPPDNWFAAAGLGTLANKTLALVGFGAIGQQIAKRALSFDMRVLAKVRTYRESPMPDVEIIESLDELLSQADHLVLALPATNDSDMLINARALSQTKSGIHIINVARASILDQDALLPLLDSGHIAQASLDVISPEPLPANHWAYSHPSVNLSPHISWDSPDVMTNMMNCFVNNLKTYLQDGALVGLVDTTAGY